MTVRNRRGGVYIDLKTIVFLDAFGNLIGALLIFAYTKRHFSKTVKYHFYSQILFGMTFSLFFFNIFIANQFLLAIANCGLLFGGAFEVFAIMRLTKNESKTIKTTILFVCFFISLIQASLVLVIDLSDIRIGLLTITLSILWFMIVYFLLKQKNASLLQKLAGFIFLITTLTLMIRGIQAFDIRGTFHWFSPEFAQVLTFLSMFAIMVVNGFGVPLLVKERADEEILLAATFDSLTEIYNRKHFIEETEKGMEYANRKKINYSLIMIDIDHFKVINDTYGHQKGDVILRNFAKTISSELRKYDIFGRVGGEEFMIFLQDISKEEALTVAEKIRELVASNMVEGIQYTISLGVCSVESNLNHLINFDELSQLCDQSLYEAKNTGRNKTVQKII